jgi:hypothetical protein
MKFTRAIAIPLVFAAAGFAQEHMADTLRSGIVAEDSRQDTSAAIQQYAAVLKQYAEARETAANALFRMAECYRKQGERGRAIAAYQRVVNEFADQSRLGARSRAVLLKTYQVTADGSRQAGKASDKVKFDQLMVQQAGEQAKAERARELYRESVRKEIEIAQMQLADAQERYKSGAGPVMDVNQYKARVAKLQTDLAAFNAGISSRPGQ